MVLLLSASLARLSETPGVIKGSLCNLVQWQTWWSSPHIVAPKPNSLGKHCEEFTTTIWIQDMKVQLWESLELCAAPKIPLRIIRPYLCQTWTWPQRMQNVFGVLWAEGTSWVIDNTSANQVWFCWDSISACSPTKIPHLPWDCQLPYIFPHWFFLISNLVPWWRWASHFSF